MNLSPREEGWTREEEEEEEEEEAI